MKKILIIGPEKKGTPHLKSELCQIGFECDQVSKSKEAQLKIYQSNHYAVIIDLNDINEEYFNVLKYLKLTSHSTYVFLYSTSKEALQTLQLDDPSLRRMGVNRVFYGKKTTEDIKNHLNEINLEKWKYTPPLSSAHEAPKPIDLPDIKFTRIKLSAFMEGNVVVFDHYLRLTANRYVKVLNRGDSFQYERFSKFSEQGVDYIYFMTKDRSTYINYLNDVAQKCIRTSSTERAITIMSSVTSKFVEEVYTAGIEPHLIDEGTTLCQSIHEVIKRRPDLNRLFEEYSEMDSENYSHLFLVTFFSSIICQNLSWTGNKSKEAIGMGALLHDIGLLKVPTNIRQKKTAEMSPKELAAFQEHPRHGYEMLSKFPYISDQVRQIVLQHHESSMGNGYPNQLTNIKILPLAKIIALADSYSEILEETKVTPIEGFKLLLNDRDRVATFDGSVLKALSMIFIQRGAR